MNNLTHVQRVRILYKTILRLHRGLPGGLKFLGDSYARDEFKKHKNCNQVEAALFMNEWAKYALSLAEQLGIRGPKTAKKLGSNLEEDSLEKMREDQVLQLYELMQASLKVGEKS